MPYQHALPRHCKLPRPIAYTGSTTQNGHPISLHEVAAYQEVQEVHTDKKRTNKVARSTNASGTSIGLYCPYRQEVLGT
jgi:hypothetical protein